jgi:hypothetical protein
MQARGLSTKPEQTESEDATTVSEIGDGLRLVALATPTLFFPSFFFVSPKIRSRHGFSSSHHLIKKKKIHKKDREVEKGNTMSRNNKSTAVNQGRTPPVHGFGDDVSLWQLAAKVDSNWQPRITQRSRPE